MGKKLTIEFVKENFEAEGYTLLNTKYINSKQKLDYICSEGHRYSITWSDWNSGNRCPYCAGLKKKTISFIKSEFEKDGYTLLTTEYINAFQKLEYTCPEGHKHVISWDRWNSGNRCPYCYGNKKLTISFIHAEFEKEGYELLTKKYTGNRQKLDYICPEGHKHSISWTNWQIGYRCYYCSALVPPTFKYIKNEIESEGYTLISDVYINAREKLIIKCPEGHIFKSSWNNWGSNNHRCQKCSIESHTGAGHPNWKGGISKEPYCQDWGKDLKEFVKERDGYKCLNPDCWCKDNMLSVHHIDYNKKSCGPENLITVCRSCNARANSDRNWHQAWYQAILNKRYGYVFNN